MYKKLLIFLFIVFYGTASLCYAKNQSKSNVLILHSYHIGYQWTDNLQPGITETLEENENLEIYVEYMDLIRNPGTEHLEMLESVYKKKYTNEGIKFDVIIVADDGAFNFLLEKRDELFFDAPIVFLGVDDFKPERIADIQDITGVNVEASIKETLEIALKLTESPQTAVVVSGSRLTERIFLNHFKKTEELFKDKIDFLYLDELEPDELREALGQLQPNDMVFHLSYLLTPSGKRLTVAESVNLIKSSTSALIFTIREFVIPYGAVGGKVVHGYSHGEAAARLALKILDGEKAGDIPVTMESPNRYMFNGQVLHEHNISEKLLPDHSIIIKRTAEHLMDEWDNIIKDSFFGYDLFEIHGSVMLLVEPESGIILDANRAAFNYYGYPGLIGKNIQEINALTEKQVEEEMQKAKRLNKNYFSFKHILVDGTVRDVEVYSYPVQINNTDILFSIVIDITEKVEAEKLIHARKRWITNSSIIALTLLTIIVILLILYLRNIKKGKKERKESEEKYSKILNNIQDVVWSLSWPDMKFLYISPSVEQLYGYTIKEFEENPGLWKEITHPDDKHLIDKAFDDLKSNGFAERESRIIQKNGSIVWIQDKSKLIKNSDGTPILIEGIATNITERKQMEQALKETNKNLEEMVYIASHDLQSPLLSMESYADELLNNYKNKLDEEGKYCLQRLKSNSSRMQSLVQSLLDISRLNTTELKPQKFELKQIVNKIMRDLSLTIDKKNANVKVNDLPTIYADKQRIETVLRNIISNALNYGGKNIEISFNDNTLSIKDDGIGIPSDQLDRVFRPGERLKSIKETEGVGMGLTFCKKVIAQHGGKIWAESEGKNKGTTIFINFNAKNILTP